MQNHDIYNIYYIIINLFFFIYKNMKNYNKYKNLYEYYSKFYKNKPINTKGDFYSFRNTYEDKYNIKKNKNNRNNLINESIDPKDILIQGLPVNTQIKYNLSLMVKAIQYGLVIMINYSGDKDNWKGGRERVIYPMVIGINRNTGNTLIRGWHLDGWSVSKHRNVKKEWRLFKSSNIKTMMFTGDFYRLIPKGYKMNDRIMTEKIIKSADFNEIRRNQDSLIKSGKLELSSEQIIDNKKSLVVKIDARTTDTIFNIDSIYSNEYIKDFKNNLNNLKLTFLKNINKNEIIVILGVLGTVNRTVKLFDNKKFIGIYKVKISISNILTLKNGLIKYKQNGNIKSLRHIDNKKEFELYTFNKII